MGTEITTAGPATKEQAIHSMRPKIERLDSRAYAEHQAVVAFELEVVSNKLDRFGWGKMKAVMKDRLTQDWMDALASFDIEEIKAACADLLRENPKAATNEQQVKKTITANRARLLARLPKAPEKPEPARTGQKFDSDAILQGVRKVI